MLPVKRQYKYRRLAEVSSRYLLRLRAVAVAASDAARLPSLNVRLVSGLYLLLHRCKRTRKSYQLAQKRRCGASCVAKLPQLR